MPLGVPALLVANQVGSAIWNTPFGGIVWGPRLSLPLVVPLVVLAAVVVGARGEAVVSRLVRSTWVWPVGLLIVAAGLPQIGWLRAAPILHRYFLHRTYCRPPTPPGYTSRAQFCHEWVTGGRIPILLDGLRTVATPLGSGDRGRSVWHGHRPPDAGPFRGGSSDPRTGPPALRPGRGPSRWTALHSPPWLPAARAGVPSR